MSNDSFIFTFLSSVAIEKSLTDLEIGIIMRQQVHSNKIKTQSTTESGILKVGRYELGFSLLIAYSATFAQHLRGFLPASYVTTTVSNSKLSISFDI